MGEQASGGNDVAAVRFQFRPCREFDDGAFLNGQRDAGGHGQRPHDVDDITGLPRHAGDHFVRIADVAVCQRLTAVSCNFIEIVALDGGFSVRIRVAARRIVGDGREDGPIRDDGAINLQLSPFAEFHDGSRLDGQRHAFRHFHQVTDDMQLVRRPCLIRLQHAAMDFYITTIQYKQVNRRGVRSFIQREAMPAVHADGHGIKKRIFNGPAVGHGTVDGKPRIRVFFRRDRGDAFRAAEDAAADV